MLSFSISWDHLDLVLPFLELQQAQVFQATRNEPSNCAEYVICELHCGRGLQALLDHVHDVFQGSFFGLLHGLWSSLVDDFIGESKPLLDRFFGGQSVDFCPCLLVSHISMNRF